MQVSVKEAPLSSAAPEVQEQGRTPTKERRGPAIITRIATFPAVICSLLIFKVFMFSMPGVGEPDIFWHLRNAEFAATHHHFPSLDTYSFTCAGMSWLNHEWLSELLYYAAFRAASWQGLWLLSKVLPAAIVMVMFYLAWKRSLDPLAAGLATMAGATLMVVGAGPRMHHFGWLCFVIVIGILQQFRLHRTGPLWIIPAIFCVWINVHGSWVFGLVVMGLIFVCGLVPRDIGRLEASAWTPAERTKLIVTGLLSTAAVFVNPFGYKLVLYPADMVLHQKLNIATVQEWLPVSFATKSGLWLGVIMAALFVAAAATKRRWRIDDLVLTIFVFYCALAHERMLTPAGIVLATMMAPFLAGLSSYDPAHERTVLNLTVLTAVLAGLVALFPKEAKLQKMIDDQFPSGAVRYLRDHGGTARLFNNYDWGGYIGSVTPQQKVFLDSRTDIFEYAGVLADYMDATTFKRTGEVLGKYDIDTALVPRGLPLDEWFAVQPTKWRLAYKDAVSVIYVRIP